MGLTKSDRKILAFLEAKWMEGLRILWFTSEQIGEEAEVNPWHVRRRLRVLERRGALEFGRPVYQGRDFDDGRGTVRRATTNLTLRPAGWRPQEFYRRWRAEQDGAFAASEDAGSRSDDHAREPEHEGSGKVATFDPKTGSETGVDFSGSTVLKICAGGDKSQSITKPSEIPEPPPPPADGGLPQKADAPAVAVARQTDVAPASAAEVIRTPEPDDVEPMHGDAHHGGAYVPAEERPTRGPGLEPTEAPPCSAGTGSISRDDGENGQDIDPCPESLVKAIWAVLASARSGPKTGAPPTPMPVGEDRRRIERTVRRWGVSLPRVILAVAGARAEWPDHPERWCSTAWLFGDAAEDRFALRGQARFEALEAGGLTRERARVRRPPGDVRSRIAPPRMSDTEAAEHADAWRDVMAALDPTARRH